MEVEQRVSVKEFMQIFGFKEYTARNLTRIADFPSIKIGNKFYIDVPRAREWFKKKENSVKVDLHEHRVVTRK